MKNLNIALVLLLSSISLISLHAQNVAETFFPVLVGRFADYHAAAPVEKLYVHQDRTKYMAGEIIWFKVYQSFSDGAQQGSGIVYVDLIDGSNSIVTQTKWKLEYGISAGHIELPDTLPAGNYQLRAYTRWMQNFGIEGFFTREISVSSSFVSQQAISQIQEKRLNLFPEGGNPVTGILSRIAFKVTDAYGKGIEAKGLITDKEGNLVRPFETEYDGMGVFNFIPEEGKEYIAKLTDSDLTVPFPEIQKQGAVVATGFFQDKFRITLRHNMGNQRPLYLTVHQNGITYFNAPLDINPETVIADIPASKLPDGIFTVTVYDETYHAWCERLCLVNYPEQLKLTAATDRETFGKRDKVTVKVEATDVDGYPQAGNFSLAVVRANLDDPHGRNNFYTNCFLNSELRGRIDNPSFYLDKSNSKELNLLLMTHGWRRYAWNEIASGKQLSFPFPIEENLSLAGKVKLRNERQNPETVELIAIFRQDSIGEVLSANPEAGGQFRFENLEFTDTFEVILSAKDSQGTLDIAVTTPPNPQSQYYSSKKADDFVHMVEIFGEMPKLSGDMENTVYQLPEIQVTTRRVRRNTGQLHTSALNSTAYEVDKNFSYTSSAPGVYGAMAILEYIPQMRRLRQGGTTFYDIVKEGPAGEKETVIARGKDI